MGYTTSILFSVGCADYYVKLSKMGKKGKLSWYCKLYYDNIQYEYYFQKLTDYYYYYYT